MNNLLKIFIILISLFLVNCTDKNKVYINQEEKLKQDEKSLLKSPMLNETLIAFISSIDSTPNPYGGKKSTPFFITMRENTH